MAKSVQPMSRYESYKFWMLGIDPTVRKYRKKRLPSRYVLAAWFDCITHHPVNRRKLQRLNALRAGRQSG